MADAWHQRSDALSSVGAFVGIFGAQLGLPIMDPLAGVVICICIVKAAIGVFIDAVNKMVDKACDDNMVQRIREMVQAEPGVESVEEIRTRMFGAKVYVDIEIAADENLRLWESHQIAENVHRTVETYFPQVKHCMVQVNPIQTECDSVQP
jgi:cation diffusion facilitator family transporter